MTNLAHMVQCWRRRHDMSLSQAAELIGVDRGALHRLEKGDSVNQSTVLQILRWSFDEKDTLSKSEAA
jgi:DNA-binding XRE family transcriptional regulator